MKIYNYEFQAKYTNATIVISVRTDEGEVVANQTALDELANALQIPADGWYVEADGMWVEDY